MRIGILEAGVPPRGLATAHGRYDAMIAELLGEAHAYSSFDVAAGGYPDDPLAFDAYIVTGASAGVHDGDAWIEALAQFIRDMRGKVKIVGICFGHQLIAQAFGGQVARAERGWGLGLHDYAITARTAWMDEAEAVAIPASHQDQVVAAPPGATIIAASAFTPVAALALDDGSAISFQGHPEFSPAFAGALIGRDGDDRLMPEAMAAARESLTRPNDSRRIAGWINRYLASYSAA